MKLSYSPNRPLALWVYVYFLLRTAFKWGLFFYVKASALDKLEKARFTRLKEISPQNCSVIMASLIKGFSIGQWL